MFFFRRQSVYVGHDVTRYSRIKDALAEAGIPCQGRSGGNNSFFFPGAGTRRSQTGSFGENPAYSYIYEIFVRPKDAEQARHIIRTRIPD